MNNLDYVDFFHAANSGHYTLFLLSLAKLFDRDSRVAGMMELRRALRTEGRGNLALAVARQLKPHEATVKQVMTIRNRSVVHNEHAITRSKVYKLNGGVTPDQLRDLIDATCNAINQVASQVGIVDPIFESDRSERATLNMLETLARGSKLKERRSE